MKNKWIKVEDKLPGIDQIVLFYCENGSIFQSFIDKDYDRIFLNQFLNGNNFTGKVTHWMDIELPKD